MAGHHLLEVALLHGFCICHASLKLFACSPIHDKEPYCAMSGRLFHLHPFSLIVRPLGVLGVAAVSGEQHCTAIVSRPSHGLLFSRGVLIPLRYCEAHIYIL